MRAKKMPEAVIYARVSSDEQKETGYSIPAQIDACKEYAQYNKLSVIRVFEVSESAKVKGRKGFNEMLNFVEKNKIKHVIFKKIDRSSRNEVDSGNIVYMALHEGMNFYFVEDNLALNKMSRPIDIAMYNIACSFASMMPRDLSNNIVNGNNKKGNMGHWIGKAPFGYVNEREDKKRSFIQINPEKAPFVKRAFDLYATGLYSYETLAKQLQKEGFKAVSRVHCTKSNVEDILKNPLYAGLEFTYGGKKYYNPKHEPIIDAGLYYKVQRIINDKSHKSTTRTFLFTGLIKCSICGCSYVGEQKTKPSGKVYTYYRCSGNKGGICKQRKKYITEAKIEEPLLDILKHLYLPDEHIKILIDMVKKEVKENASYAEHLSQNYDRQISNLRTRMSKLFDMHVDGEVGEELFREKNREYQRQLDTLLEEYGVIQKTGSKQIEYAKTMLELCKNAYNWYLSRPLEEKRQLIKLLCSNLTHDAEKPRYELNAVFQLMLDFNKNQNGGGREIRTLCLTGMRLLPCFYCETKTLKCQHFYSFETFTKSMKLHINYPPITHRILT
jgi:DNA invertase Pin-like site-specific DNA recombinase